MLLLGPHLQRRPSDIFTFSFVYKCLWTTPHSFRALSYLGIEGTSSVYLTYAYAYMETRTNYWPRPEAGGSVVNL